MIPNNPLYVLQMKQDNGIQVAKWTDVKSHGNVISSGSIDGIMVQVIAAEFNPDEFYRTKFQIVKRELVTKEEVVS